MGQVFSNAWGSGRSGPEEGDSAGRGAYRYPPKNGAPYFASHFIMGGEKFDSPQPESFLFGENSDLNFLGSKAVSFPYPPPQANEPTKTLKSLINIRRDSVHFVTAISNEADGSSASSSSAAVADFPGVPSAENEQTKEDEKCYNVEFTFDCDARCAITIYYFCIEEVHSSGTTYSSKRRDLTSETFEFKRGANQVFKQPMHIFQPSTCAAELDSFAEDSEGIPVAIHCVALEGDAPRQSHTTLCTIEKYSDSSYVLKALKQKLFVDGLCYLLQEIYGLENKVEATKQSSEDEVDDCGAECVVCMCDLRDTIILPCRHLCLCNACADSLRYQANNCPICRAPFRALLQIRAVQKMGQVTHPALADSDAGQEGVPPGFQGISLIEALNGPLSVAPPPPPPMCSLANERPGEKKNRKSKNKSHVNSKSAKPSASSTSARSERVVEEEDAQSSPASDSGRGDAAGGSSSSGSKVLLKYVNEVSAGSSSAVENLNVAKQHSSSVDLVEEELAQMAIAESLDDIALESRNAADQNEDFEIAEDEEEEDAAGTVVIINSSRVSIPGTPTSNFSVRSLQDSSSSSSSTKQLLSHQAQLPPITTGAAILVKVHPCTEQADDEDVCYR